MPRIRGKYGGWITQNGILTVSLNNSLQGDSLLHLKIVGSHQIVSIMSGLGLVSQESVGPELSLYPLKSTVSKSMEGVLESISRMHSWIDTCN